MQENHIAVEKTARYFTIGEAGENTREVWYVCHGYGQLAKYFIKHFEVLDNGSRLIVAPEGLSRFYLNGFSGRIGATWMTKEDRLNEIEDYLGFLNTLHAHIFKRLYRENVKITVLGFSQGTATVCRWLTEGNIYADRLILWAGLMPPEIDFQTDGKVFQGLQNYVVLGKNDPFANQEMLDQQKAILKKHQIPYKFLTFDGEHEIHDDTLRKIAK